LVTVSVLGVGKMKTFLKSVYKSVFFRRFLRSLLSLLGLSLLIFVLARVLPGDPIRAALGPDVPEEAAQRYREMLNLDKPLYLQYFYWLRDVFQFKLGKSLVTMRDVSADIADFFPATLELLLASTIFRIIVAFPLGVLSGKKPGSAMDNAMRVLAYIGICIPTFGWAIILQLIFAYWLNWLPATGRISEEFMSIHRVTGLMTIDTLIGGNLPAFIDALKHLLIPAVALSIGGAVQEARILRAGMIENIGRDYVLNMRSHGIPERIIYFKYVFKPSIIAVVPTMGLDIASSVGNAFLVETICNWPGMSRYGMIAMLRKDLNAIVGVVLVIGLVYIVINTITDVILYAIDPRLRFKEREES
jgi:peptide/nickel transport system permease protein